MKRIQSHLPFIAACSFFIALAVWGMTAPVTAHASAGDVIDKINKTAASDECETAIGGGGKAVGHALGNAAAGQQSAAWRGNKMGAPSSSIGGHLETRDALRRGSKIIKVGGEAVADAIEVTSFTSTAAGETSGGSWGQGFFTVMKGITKMAVTSVGATIGGGFGSAGGPAGTIAGGMAGGYTAAKIFDNTLGKGFDAIKNRLGEQEDKNAQADGWGPKIPAGSTPESLRQRSEEFKKEKAAAVEREKERVVKEKEREQEVRSKQKEIQKAAVEKRKEKCKDEEKCTDKDKVAGIKEPGDEGENTGPTAREIKLRDDAIAYMNKVQNMSTDDMEKNKEWIKSESDRLGQEVDKVKEEQQGRTAKKSGSVKNKVDKPADIKKQDDDTEDNDSDAKRKLAEEADRKFIEDSKKAQGIDPGSESASTDHAPETKEPETVEKGSVWDKDGNKITLTEGKDKEGKKSVTYTTTDPNGNVTDKRSYDKHEDAPADNSADNAGGATDEDE